MPYPGILGTYVCKILHIIFVGSCVTPRTKSRIKKQHRVSPRHNKNNEINKMSSFRDMILNCIADWAVSLTSTPVRTYEDVAAEVEKTRELQAAAEDLEHTAIKLRVEQHERLLELSRIKEDMEMDYLAIDGSFICKDCNAEKTVDCLRVCIDCFEVVCVDCMKDCRGCHCALKCKACLGGDEEEWACVECTSKTYPFEWIKWL